MGKNRKLQFAIRAALATAAASAIVPMAISQTAPTAKTADASLAEVVVTGSRLHIAPNDVSIAPVTSVTSLDIQQTGLVRTEDLLNNLPQVIAESSSGQSISSVGVATVSLRGLGSQRTLVLVNGRRLAPGAALNTSTNSADINQIPAELIERVDVLTGGASAVYGADAVAGVVNFVMNTHFEGVKFDANYGFGHHKNDNQAELGYLTAANRPLPGSSVNAGYNKDLSFVAGSNFADGKGNVTVYATYLNSAPAVGAQYDFAGCTLNTPGTPKKLQAPNASVKCGGSSSSATGRFFLFGQSGTSAFATLADKTVDAKTGAFRDYVGATDSFNYGALSYLQRQAERYTAGSFFNLDINDTTRVYSETMFARNTSHAQYGPSGLFAFGTPVISCDNPLLQPDQLAALCSPANIAANQATFGPANGGGFPKGGNPLVAGRNILLYVARRSVESGPRTDDYSGNSIRELVGVKGSWGEAWTYDAYGQLGISTIQDNQGGFLGTQQINRALNVVTGPDGKPACQSAINGDDPACLPWNIWTPGGVTADQLKYLTVQSGYSIKNTEYVVDASATGNLEKYGVKIPSASSGMSINVGAEYRQEKVNFTPDYIFGNGFASGGGAAIGSIDNKGFHVGEAFTEMRLPIIDEKPGAYELAAEAGYRYSDYNTGYKTNTYKFGVEWAPIKDIRIRGAYNRAVRAPSVGDLYSPPVIGAGGTADPCWGGLDANGLVNGHSRTFCANTGVTDLEYGKIVANPAAQINTSTGGNSTLTPEISDTYTFGFVAQPEWVPGLVLSVDYYDITIKNTIESLSSNTVINDCGITGNAALCGLIHRGGGTGSLWFNTGQFVNTNEINIGKLATKGIDIAAHYLLDAGAVGKFGFTFSGTKVNSFIVQPVSFLPSYDCAGYFGTTCSANNGPTPKWHHVAETNWATPWAGLDVTLRWRYIGSMNTDRSSSDPQLKQLFLKQTAHIGGYSYLDMSASVPLPGGVNLRFGVNNIADKAPPIIANGNYSDCPNLTCNDNTFVGTYDTLGRYMYAHASVKF